MTKYKWDTKELEDDIYQLQNMLKSNDKLIKYQAYKDLNKLLYLLQDVARFDNNNVALTLKNKVKVIIDNNKVDEVDDIYNHHQDLKHIQNINICSLKFVNRLYRYKLKRKRQLFKPKTTELEAIYIIRDMFKNFDSSLLNLFDQYLNSSKIYINNDKKQREGTFVVYINSLSKAYTNVNYHQINDIEGLLFGFFKTTLAEMKENRQLSIFNKSLETFFNLIVIDSLKEKGYKSYYEMKRKILNQMNYNLDEFRYITSNSDYIIYKSNTNKYSIKIINGIIDAEMSDYYHRGISYKNLMKPIISIYSNLVAFSLYDRYRSDKVSTAEDIHFLINNIGYIDDLKILEKLFPNIEKFNNCDYYNKYINQAKIDYQLLKRK